MGHSLEESVLHKEIRTVRNRATNDIFLLKNVV